MDVNRTEGDRVIELNAPEEHYTLLAGRWFHAGSIEGSWEWVSGDKVPRDFTKISADSPMGHALASIPGAEQAREAVIANHIPQTATVRRNEVKLEVHYNDAPQFRPIDGTSMEYAINTSSEVIHAVSLECIAYSPSTGIRIGALQAGVLPTPNGSAARGIRTTRSVAGDSPDDVSPNAGGLKKRSTFAGGHLLEKEI